MFGFCFNISTVSLCFNNHLLFLNLYVMAFICPLVEFQAKLFKARKRLKVSVLTPVLCHLQRSATVFPSILAVIPGIPSGHSRQNKFEKVVPPERKKCREKIILRPRQTEKDMKLSFLNNRGYVSKPFYHKERKKKAFLNRFIVANFGAPSSVEC